MTGKWHFRPIARGETIRESTAAAFFASDAVGNLGSALIREGIQNSLDSGKPGEPTVIRISLISEADAPSWDMVERYFTDAWAHYRAESNGLHPDEIPDEGVSCKFLVFEDFGTYGLRGDPTAAFSPRDSSENNFFHFFRAEGRTDKDTSKRGSWGLGKDTFFRASWINTLFGMTIRADDGRRMLMGKTVLRYHYLSDEIYQEGYFGIRPDVSDHFVMPVEDDDAIEEFLNVFRSYRRNESGLSIFVPWTDPEISGSEMIRSVFRNYFYSILAGHLEVMVEADKVEIWLDKNSLLEEARKLPQVEAYMPISELAEWALTDLEDGDRHQLSMPNPRRGWSWDSSLFPEEMSKTLRDKLEDSESVAIRVPVTVRRRGAPPQESYFDVYMRRDGSDQRQRPVFIREGIVVSDVNAPYIRGTHALVVVDDQPLSAFLRQSENPSHTLWQGQQVRKDYVSGVGDLDFVVQSVRRILDVITTEAQEEDRFLLADLFPIPGQGRVEDGGAPHRPPPPSPSHFSINAISRGFTITPDQDRLATGSTIRRGVIAP